MIVNIWRVVLVCFFAKILTGCIFFGMAVMDNDSQLPEALWPPSFDCQIDEFLADVDSKSCGFLKDKYVSGRADYVYLLEQYFLKMCSNFPSESIELLVRGLVRLENCFGTMQVGSASEVHRFISLLKSREYINYTFLIRWLKVNSVNPYVPYGRFSGLSDEEVSKKLLREKEEGKRRRNKKRVEGQIKMRSQIKRQQNESRIRLEMIDVLRCMRSVERLRYIAHDDSRSIYFYSVDLFMVSRLSLGSLEKSIKRKLIGKLDRAPNGAWKVVRKNLINSL